MAGFEAERQIAGERERSLSQAGYSVVETLVALVILSAVLVPTSALLVRLAAMQPAKDLVVAMALARMTLEESIAAEDYTTRQWQTEAAGRLWQIERRVERDWRLVHLTVRARPIESSRWVYSLYTCRPRPK